jgi:hypothetical protein
MKDKLVKGEYIVLVSVWNRLGGNIIDYDRCKLHKKWKRFTEPKFHRGKHYDNALKFEETLNILAPSTDEI